MDKILGILWHYTPRGIPPMASSSLLLDNRPPLDSTVSIRRLQEVRVVPLFAQSAPGLARARLLPHAVQPYSSGVTFLVTTRVVGQDDE